MRLAELPVGTGILFDVSIQKQELEFPSEVVEVHDNFILTKPVMSKGKVVGLGGEGVSVSLTYSRNDKAPIVWKGVGCSVVKTKGRVLYKVIASGAGFEVNRREAFRLFVGLEGIARVGTNRRAMDVILKDLSDTGFAFVVDHEIEDATGLSVRLVFKDFDRNYDPYKVAYGSMPTHASANPEIKHLYINGHFCYVFKFGIVTNGLGIICHISFGNLSGHIIIISLL